MIYTGTQTFCQHSTRNLWYIITLTAKSRPIPCRVTTNHQLATIQGRSINLPYSFQDYVEKSYQMIITAALLSESAGARPCARAGSQGHER